MQIQKVERFLTPSGALFETEEEATNEMLNYASQLAEWYAASNVTPHPKSPRISANPAPKGTERSSNRRRTK